MAELPEEKVNPLVCAAFLLERKAHSSKQDEKEVIAKYLLEPGIADRKQQEEGKPKIAKSCFPGK